MTTKKTMLVLSLMLAMMSVAFGADDAATQQLAQAKAAYDAKNAVQAVALYSDFLGKFPNDARASEARYFLAESYLQMQDYANAGTQYKTLMDASPTSEYGRLALFRIGEIPYLLEKYDVAKSFLKSFVEQFQYDACNRFAIYYLGDIAMQQGNVDEAAYYFSECMRLFPTGDRFADSKLGMAWVKERQNDFAGADAIYSELTSNATNPVAEEALCRWGTVQHQRGENTKAIETLSSFIARYPASSWKPYAQMQLAETYRDEGRFAEALTTLQTISPITDEVRLVQASCYFGLGRGSEADAILRVVEQNPAFADEAALVRADASYTAQDWRDAIARYERLLQTQYNPAAQRVTVNYFTKTSEGGLKLLADNKVMRAAQRLVLAYAASGANDQAIALYTSLRSYARGNAARQAVVDETYTLISKMISPSLLTPPNSGNVATSGSDEEKLQRAAQRYAQQDYSGALAIVEPLLGMQYLTIPTPRMTISYQHQGVSTAPPTIPGMSPIPVAVDPNKLTLASLQQACSLLTLCYALKGDAVRANAAMEMLKTRVAAGDSVGQEIVQQTQQLLTQIVAKSPAMASTTPSRGGLVPLSQTGMPPTNPAASPPLDGGDYRKTLQTARTLVKNRQYAQADAMLTQLLAQDVSGTVAAEATFLRAETLVALKKTGEAIPLYESILKDYPSSRQCPDALWALGTLYERRGDSTAASDYFARIVEDYSDFGQIDGALYYLAWNEIENGSVSRATSYLQRIDRNYPQGAYWSHAAWTMAWLAYRSKNSEQARHYIDKIFAATPDESIYDRVLYLKGRLAMENQSWAIANAAFQELRRARPDSPLRDAADHDISIVRSTSAKQR
ncbi:MAG: tetratricopeptide repeat protein [Thermoguttaceae bacterium]